MRPINNPFKPLAVYYTVQAALNRNLSNTGRGFAKPRDPGPESVTEFFH